MAEPLNHRPAPLKVFMGAGELKALELTIESKEI